MCVYISVCPCPFSWYNNSLCFIKIAQGFAVFTPIEDCLDLAKKLKKKKQQPKTKILWIFLVEFKSKIQLYYTFFTFNCSLGSFQMLALFWYNSCTIHSFVCNECKIICHPQLYCSSSCHSSRFCLCIVFGVYIICCMQICI